MLGEAFYAGHLTRPMTGIVGRNTALADWGRGPRLGDRNGWDGRAFNPDLLLSIRILLRVRSPLVSPPCTAGSIPSC